MREAASPFSSRTPSEIFRKNQLQLKGKNISLAWCNLQMSLSSLTPHAAPLWLLQFVGTLSASHGISLEGMLPDKQLRHVQRLTDSKIPVQQLMRRSRGTHASRRMKSAFKDPLKPDFKYSSRAVDCWGKKHWQTGKPCLQGSRKGKPFKAEAWEDTESKKQSWINIDSAVNNQAHLYLGKQVKVTHQSVFLAELTEKKSCSNTLKERGSQTVNWKEKYY